ncbi:MAG: hypothetical protein J6B74_01845 [Ruminococcus sp.]|nr:hypothetical protein [Ruminococcus sp.]
MKLYIGSRTRPPFVLYSAEAIFIKAEQYHSEFCSQRFSMHSQFTIIYNVANYSIFKFLAEYQDYQKY